MTNNISNSGNSPQFNAGVRQQGQMKPLSGRMGSAGEVLKRGSDSRPLVFDSKVYFIPGEKEFQASSFGDQLDFSLRQVPTQADGSCGLHAMFGQFGAYEKNGQSFASCYLAGVKEKREELALWVSEGFSNDQVPDLIRESLLEYLKNPNNRPSYIKEALENPNGRVLTLLGQINESSDQDQKDRLYESLMKEPSIIVAYLEHLKSTTSFLLDKELAAIAEKEGFNLNIYTLFDNVAYLNTSYDSGTANNLDLIFTEPGHYDRAERKDSGVRLQQLSENQKSQLPQMLTKEESEERDRLIALQYQNEEDRIGRSLQSSPEVPRPDVIATSRKVEDAAIGHDRRSLSEEVPKVAEAAKIGVSPSDTLVLQDDIPLSVRQETVDWIQTEFEKPLKDSMFTLMPAFTTRLTDPQSRDATSSKFKEVLREAFKAFRADKKNPDKHPIKNPEVQKAYKEELLKGALIAPDLNVIKEVKENRKITPAMVRWLKNELKNPSADNLPKIHRAFWDRLIISPDQENNRSEGSTKKSLLDASTGLKDAVENFCARSDGQIPSVELIAADPTVQGAYIAFISDPKSHLENSDWHLISSFLGKS